MKNYYHPNEHERYADFIEEMLKALKNNEPEEVKEDEKMKNVNYHPNEHERYADFIEEMLKALKNKN